MPSGVARLASSPGSPSPFLTFSRARILYAKNRRRGRAWYGTLPIYGGPGGHASCQWLSRITPVLTPPTVVTSQCALRNAAVLAAVVIPVQCPYRRLPGFTWCPSCSRHSSQVSVAYLVLQRTIHACALEHARVRLTANPETQASMLALICVAVILLVPQCVALSRNDPQVDSEFERQSS